MEGWLKKYEKGGNIKVEDINNQQPQIKPARGKVEQFLLNLAGGWEHNKPQLLKDAPILDYAIQPTLDYLAGKGGEENALAILPSFGKIKDIKNLLKKTESNVSKNFKSEIDWAKWNPDTPKYPELINEYNTIEESTKKAGTWMKNPDGSKFKGTPEQFVQQQSSWFKKAFPDYYGEILNHNSPYKFNEFNDINFGKVSDDGWYGKGTYAHPDKSYTSLYGPNNYEIYVNSPNKGNVTEKTYSASSVYKKNIVDELNKLENKKNNALKEIESNPEIYNDINDVLKKRINDSYDLNKKILIEKFSSKYTNSLDDYTTLTNPYNGEVVIPFDNKIKSARGNVGFFDITNPNIYKSLVPIGIGLGAHKLNEEYKNGGEVNANEEYVSIPPNFVGSGYDISGRRFSPAWGGQFEDGGALQKIAGYHPVVAGAKKLMSNFAENMDVYNYTAALERVIPATFLNKKDYLRTSEELANFPETKERIDLLQLLANKKQQYNSVPDAEYTPSNAKNKNTKYYKSPYTEEQLNAYINSHWIAKPILSKEDLPKLRSATLGNMMLDYGTDEKGNYISYYDKWDLNPIPQTGINWIDKTVDKVVTGVPNALGITNTPEVYGRVYLPEKRNGGEMKYYQEGLDFKPNNISKNGSELKKLDQLTNFNNFGQDKKWLNKYL